MMNKITVETITRVKVERGDITYEATWDGGNTVTLLRNGVWLADINVEDGGEEFCALLGLGQTLLVVIRERQTEAKLKQEEEEEYRELHNMR